ncbi:MAG: hypothetical protein PVF50_01670 [Gammaproteobacteria bacterium]|jgi:hypothetical protein
MTDPFDAQCVRCAHFGAALVTVLVLIAAIAALTGAVLHDVTLTTAMTRHFAAQVRARHAALSAIETLLAEVPLSAGRELRRELRLGPDEQFDAVVTVRYLGETAARPKPGDATSAVTRHFEITARIADGQGTRHRRRLFQRIVVNPGPPVQ